jgi:hypothetical protein
LNKDNFVLKQKEDSSNEQLGQKRKQIQDITEK